VDRTTRAVRPTNRNQVKGERMREIMHQLNSDFVWGVVTGALVVLVLAVIIR
jgi:hypothetical protein